MDFEQIQLNTLGQYLSVFLPSSRVYWLYLVCAVVLAFVAYLQFNHGHDEDDEEIEVTPKKSFLAFLFDKDVYLHRSTWQDVKYFAINAIVYYGVVTQFLIGTHGFALFFNNGLSSVFGEVQAPIITNELGLVVYTILSVIALDLGVYISHRAQHAIPILWEFHKVHHSAEKMTPITLFRMHPVDLFITALTTSFLGGLAFAGLFYLTGEKPQALTLFGLNIIVFVFYIAGYNLRHSHIWLNYPVWLSKILISPAQHQIHHSTDPKQFDRNFGLIFSIWDQLGRSHYIPRGFEKLTFGLNHDEPNPFKSIAEIYYKPFVWAGGIISKAIGNPRRKIIAGLIFCMVLLGYHNFSDRINGQLAQSQLSSVHLAQLTWTEVDKALDDGYDTILIPTGGIEQNGPHVVLGKHNVVITYTAEKIARALGNTLVAPVIDYVPEGAIEPKPDGHMAFAGTISIPEAVFEQVLEATASSMKAHGFKNIFFIGDSGGNQKAQEKVAKHLSVFWQDEGVIVGHVGDYYAQNGQFSYLQEAGYSEAEIGYHAGMRDTSELLYIAPSAVHKYYVVNPQGTSSGVSGNPQKASKSIGRKMVKLKVDAALQQMRTMLETKTNAH
ncbi:MAG: creatininase family protein [Hyphomicrobiales bacterium]